MAPSPESDLGSRVRQLREEKGWSQSELAARIPGVRQQSIDQLEQGQVKRPRFLPELALALDTTVQWLLTGQGAAKRKPGAALTDIDTALLRDVFVAVEKALNERDLKLEHEHKAQLVGALYELMRDDKERDAQKLLQAAGNIVSYDQMLRRGRH